MPIIARILSVVLVLNTLSIVSLAQVDLSQGLIALYTFNGNADDASGNGNNGTPHNGVQLTTDRFGNANSAYVFDGIDDYIQIPNSASLNPTDGMSIALYFNPAKNGVQTIIGKINYNQQNGTQFQIAMDFAPQPGVLFGVNPPSSDCFGSPLNAAYVNTNSSITLDQWYCVVATYDKGEMKIYLNGTLIETVASGFSTLGQCPNAGVQIGSWWTGDLQRFKGKIDDIRIYNRALNQDEVNVLCPASLNTIPSFTAPDTVCVNTPVAITNTSINATSYFWNFCVADINKAPQGQNLGNISNNLNQPVFMDFVQANNLYYGFSVNFNGGHLIRHDFGNSLLNTPTSVDLGNFGNIIPPASSAEGIQVVQNEGRWYAIIVGGYPGGNSPRIVKIDFGPNITNPSPAATNWGDIGNLNQPIDLHIFKENNIWYGFTVNSEDNSITRFNFTNSFNNTPTGDNLGNIGGLQYPTGIYAINDNGYWRVFITNAGNNTRSSGVFSLTRLDFGTSLLNIPTGQNLGSLGGVLKHPRDLTIMKSCGQIVGFAVNGHLNDRSLVKLDFNNDLSVTPAAISLGNIGNLSFPHSLSKLFRVNEDIYSFVTNVDNNTLTRLRFTGCTNASVPNFSGPNPPAITYDLPGTYNINLTVDDGLPTQSSVCKQVVVLPDADFTYNQNICDPLVVDFFGPANNPNNINWKFGDGTQDILDTLSHTYTSFGDYEVEINYDGACAAKKTVTVNMIEADVILTPDTVICNGSSKQLRTVPSTEFCWFPTTYLDDPNSPNPITSTPHNITYYFTAKIQGVVQQDSIVIIAEIADVQTNNDTLVCSKSPVPLIATGAVTYSWAPATDLSDENIFNPVASPGNTTEYIVTGTTANGCTDKDTVVININPLPAVGLTQDTLICRNAYAPLQASGGITYSWSPANGLDYTNIADPIAKPDTATTYKVLVTDANNCTNEDSVTVSLRPYPLFGASPSQIICDGTVVRLTAEGGDNYVWLPAGLVDDPSSPSPITSPHTTTDYSVYIHESACGFDTTINMTIAVNPVPVITVSKSNDINCNVPTAQLNANGALSYVWSPASVLDRPNAANPVASIDTIILFSVTGNNQFGCTTTEYITVKADQSGVPRFVVPNAFTPNGDGKNDCFGIRRWGSTTITQFSIYNRWGQLLFQTRDPYKCWDGTFNGKPQDAGGYIYVIHASTICGFIKREGVLTLVR